MKEYFNKLANIIDAKSDIASSNKHKPDTGDNREDVLEIII